MAHILKISIAGNDQPEVSNAFTRIRQKSDAILLDINGSLLRGALALAFMSVCGQKHTVRAIRTSKRITLEISYATSLAQVPDLANA